MEKVEVECVTGKWTVSLYKEELRVVSPSGEMLHRSHGHLMAGKHIVMFLSEMELSRGERKAFLEQLSLRDKEIEMLKDSLQDRMRAYSELAERTGNL
jgi:hypothetical protein